MKALLRNAQHGSDINLIKEFSQLGLPIYIYKSSSTIKGIRSIKNELNGSHWYTSLFKSELDISIVAETSLYCKLRSKYLYGETYPYTSGFSKNKAYLAIIMNHYCDLWPNSSSQKGLYNMHGDFSIENVIFCDSSPTVIDWEHFHEFIAPIGFDALNLLFEQFWFEGEEGRRNHNIIKQLAEMLLILKKRNALALYFCKQPLRKTIAFIEGNSDIWNDQVDKLPVIKFTDEEIMLIDQTIEEVLSTNF
jgi:hypothetical protein